MNDDIPQELVDRMMVKCARRCCICRRFRPTKLQVHHIQERSQGGTNAEDNLIVVCFSCHSDVHTKVPFARRFSQEELKGHRDALVQMVEVGKFPNADMDDTDEVIREVLENFRATAKPKLELLPEAVEILLQAANTQGHVFIMTHTGGITLQAGKTVRTLGHNDRRSLAVYKKAIDQLVGCGLLEKCDGGMPATPMFSQVDWDVTYEGYLAADEIMVSQGQVSTIS